jgi:hypothetical protein
MIPRVCQLFRGGGSIDFVEEEGEANVRGIIEGDVNTLSCRTGTADTQKPGVKGVD